MCGRYARFTILQEFCRMAGLPANDLQCDETSQSWNTAPGTACALIRCELDREPELDKLIWGLIPHWAKQRPAARPINARLETAAEKQMYKRIFRYRRCLVAADGWYEWLSTPQGKQPYFLRYQDARPFFFGGLWNEWSGPDGAVTTFTVLTQPASPEIAHLHDRMPVIVPPEYYAAWLDKDVSQPAEVFTLCRPPAPGELLARRVATAVNRTDANRVELIAPI